MYAQYIWEEIPGLEWMPIWCSLAEKPLSNDNDDTMDIYANTMIHSFGEYLYVYTFIIN